MLPNRSDLRVRLPLTGDRDALHELLAAYGLSASDLDVRRALRWTPDRPVVVAARWDGAVERLVGYAALGEAPTVVAAHDVAELLQEYESRRVA